MGWMRHRAAFLLAPTLIAATARAESTDVNDARSRGYYTTHIALSVALLGANLAVPFAFTVRPSSTATEVFPGDLSVRDNVSNGATAASDVLVAGTLVAPLAAQLGRGFDTPLLNYSIIYREAVGLEHLFNTLV